MPGETSGPLVGFDFCGVPSPAGVFMEQFRCTRPAGHDEGHYSSIAGCAWTNHQASARAFRDTSPETVLGVELAEGLPDGWQPQGVVVLVRAIDADGHRRVTHLEGGDVMLWEAMGMISLAACDFGARLDSSLAAPSSPNSTITR